MILHHPGADPGFLWLECEISLFLWEILFLLFLWPSLQFQKIEPVCGFVQLCMITLNLDVNQCHFPSLRFQCHFSFAVLLRFCPNFPIIKDPLIDEYDTFLSNTFHFADTIDSSPLPDLFHVLLSFPCHRTMDLWNLFEDNPHFGNIIILVLRGETAEATIAVLLESFL